MKPGIPWSVKGIEAEAREAAKFAARRSGMTLGEWLNSMILEQAEGGDDVERRYGHRRSSTPSRHALGDADDLRQRLDALADQLSSLNLRDQDTATSRYLARSIQDPEADPALKSVMRRLENNEIHFTGAIDKIAERIDELAGRLDEPPAPVADQRVDDLMTRMDANEQHTSHAIDRMGEELGNLAHQVAKLPTMKSFDKPEDVPGFSSLETALRNVVDHIEVSDKRTRDTLKTLQDRISATHKLAEAADSGPDPDQRAALDRLERQLTTLAERMERQEKKGIAAVKQLVDEKFSRLSEQVSTVSHSADTLVAKAETAAGRLAERQVHEAEERLKSMIAEATAKAARQDDGIELGRLRSDIESMGRRLEALKSDTASQREVRSLKTALEEVTSTVKSGPDMAPLAELEERIAALSGELNARAGQGAMDDHLMALAGRLDELDGAVRAMAEPAGGGDESEISNLRQHIAAVDERLSATEQQLGHLQTIENSIAQLFEAVEHNKTSTEEIAEATARRVADEMTLRGTSEGAENPETASAIKALQDGLSAVKASADTADQRNHETLEAVHETLEQIISKLGELESWHTSAAANIARQEADTRSQTDPEAASDDAADTLAGITEAGITEASSEDTEETPWQALMPDLGGHDSIAAGAAADDSGEDDDSFMPSLPSSIEADGEVAGTEPELPAEPLLGADDSGDTADTVKPAREDFIAAARRAAQTAQPRSGLAASGAFKLFARKKSAETKPAAEPTAPTDAAAPKKSLLSMAFLKGKASSGGKAPAKAADEAPASAEEAAARRKRLILVGTVLLAAAAAYSFNAQRNAVPPASPPAKVGELDGVKEPAPARAIEHAAVVAPQAQVPAAGIAPVQAVRPAPVQTASTTPVHSALASHSGIASADSLDAPTPADPITTASLSPRNAAQPATRNPDVASRLSALVSGTATDKAVAEPAAGLPETIGTAALRQAALSGNPSAQFVVASRYLEGKGTARDAAAAARWYQRAAAQSLVNAQYRLATLFERGLGVPKDPAAARMWYERAAEAGNVRAMHNLAVMLADNTGGKADYPAAARWFSKAAEYGLKDSQFNLAVLKERGLGVTADRKEAYRLYSLAAREGDADAAARAKTLRNYLSSTELASIDSQVAAWVPRKIDRTANFVTIDDKSWNVEVDKVAKPLPPSPELTGTSLITRAQQLLTRLGFDVGTPDGVMGSRTANAVRMFQMKNGLTVNGMVSNDLLRQLMAQAG